MAVEDGLLVTEGKIDDATITIRVIKSFSHRTIRNIVFRGLDLSKVTAGDLLTMVREKVSTESGFRPYRSMTFDTLKIYTHAHFTKTMNLAINLDHDDWILDNLEETLASRGLQNESEISCFNRELYEEFKASPVENWHT